jgi:hypothetical protein
MRNKKAKHRERRHRNRVNLPFEDAVKRLLNPERQECPWQCLRRVPDHRCRLAWAAVLLLLPLILFDAAAAQGPDRVLSEPPAWKLQKPKSTRTLPEKRIELGNRLLRLDFDPRSSDTSYNYLWIRRPDTGRWLRVHNFGIDVHAPKAGDNQDINCVGINLSLALPGFRWGEGTGRGRRNGNKWQF